MNNSLTNNRVFKSNFVYIGSNSNNFNNNRR